METTKKRATPWKEGKIISIQLRNGKYILAQMIKEPYLIFFNLFNNDNNWNGTILSKYNILFCKAVLRQFIKLSEAKIVKNVSPLLDYNIPNVWINFEGFSQKRIISIKDKKYELILIGEYCSLVERDMSNQLNNKINGIYKQKLISHIKENDWSSIDGVEDMGLEIYPLLNERLYLCSIKGQNVNPYLDMMLDKNLPDYYESYLDVMTCNGKKFGYF